MPRIAIDFDGTINIAPWGEPFALAPNCLKTLKYLRSKKHILILHTLRGNRHLDEALDWLSKFFVFDEVNSQADFTDSPKVWADMYVDDQSFNAPLTKDGNFDWLKLLIWSLEHEMKSRAIYYD